MNRRFARSSSLNSVEPAIFFQSARSRSSSAVRSCAGFGSVADRARAMSVCAPTIGVRSRGACDRRTHSALYRGAVSQPQGKRRRGRAVRRAAGRAEVKDPADFSYQTERRRRLDQNDVEIEIRRSGRRGSGQLTWSTLASLAVVIVSVRVVVPIVLRVRYRSASARRRRRRRERGQILLLQLVVTLAHFRRHFIQLFLRIDRSAEDGSSLRIFRGQNFLPGNVLQLQLALRRRDKQSAPGPCRSASS